MRIFLTGDTHCAFRRIGAFCEKMRADKEDILIILGDAGVNYDGYVKDRSKKEYLQSLPITIFCIHGNHEMRASALEYYSEVQWHGGTVYWEAEYPNLFFAKDGEIYNFNGMKTIVIGGAYSIDKMYRLTYRLGWWPDEQPSEEIKAYVEQQLERMNWEVDIVLSHTASLKYEPVEAFLKGIDQSLVDKTTETWLDKLEEKLTYQKWYLGHYHIEKKVNDKVEILFENYQELGY